MNIKYLLFFIIFVFGIAKNTNAMNYNVHDGIHETYKSAKLLPTSSVEDVNVEKGRNGKHPNFSARFIKTNTISNEFREISIDSCDDVEISSFNNFYSILIRLFKPIEIDLKGALLPLYILFNNYRL